MTHNMNPETRDTREKRQLRGQAGLAWLIVPLIAMRFA